MNIHEGVAIRSDVAKLRDGTSALRDLLGDYDAAMGSKRKQKDMKRKLQLIMDVQTFATDDIHTHMGAVKGAGSSEYVAKRLATDAKFASASNWQTQSDLWRRLQHVHDTDKENRHNKIDTPVRARTTSSAHSSTTKKKEIPVPDDIIHPCEGTAYTPEQAVKALVEVPAGYRTKVIQSWIERQAIPIKKPRGMLKRVQAYEVRGMKSGALDPWFKRGAKPFCPTDDVQNLVQQRAPNETVGAHDVRDLLAEQLGPLKEPNEKTVRNYTAMAMKFCDTSTQNAVHQTEARLIAQNSLIAAATHAIQVCASHILPGPSPTGKSRPKDKLALKLMEQTFGVEHHCVHEG